MTLLTNQHKINRPPLILQHGYQLRVDLKTTVDLPHNLSEDEAGRLANLIEGSAFAEESGNETLQTYQFPIREKLSTTIDLPINLTSCEALRLGEFIKSLPFEDYRDDFFL